MAACAVLLVDHHRMPACIRRDLDGERRAKAEPGAVQGLVRRQKGAEIGFCGLAMLTFPNFSRSEFPLG